MFGFMFGLIRFGEEELNLTPPPPPPSPPWFMFGLIRCGHPKYQVIMVGGWYWRGRLQGVRPLSV
jgi:hypothetical protein